MEVGVAADSVSGSLRFCAFDQYQSSSDGVQKTTASIEVLSVLVDPVAKKRKTYNRKDSPVVTHLSTNFPICSLDMAERTGCLVLYSLWSCVVGKPVD